MSLVGRHIGRYRILEQLGQGGMSVVYKGLDTSLDREVAVKVLHAHLAGKEESRRRLAREAKAVAKLHHPNILEIYDFSGEDTEEAYLVTEYIRGQTLRQYAEHDGFEPPEIAALVIHEIAAALAQAHEAGIIHRDLKPENVMVREDGVLKLMDFGIARIIDRDDKMTMTGALVGSPAHMAPEIIEGEEAGPEADVFSLGTMLFYFATGRMPFSAPNTTATLKRILDGLYDDPRQLVPTVSDELAEIIATCLARQPSSRYPNATRLRDALHEYLSALGLTHTTEELQAFFADPQGYRKQLVPRVCAALITRADSFLSDHRPARALAALNQVLALEPQNERAVRLLGEMNLARRRQRTWTLWKRVALGAAAVAVLAAAAVPAWRVLQPPARSLAEGKQGVSSPQEPAPTAEKQLPEPVPAPIRQPPGNPAPKPPVLARASDARLPLARVMPRALLPVTVRVLPYGKVKVDDGAWTNELPAHLLQLAPGPHTLQYTCRYCEVAKESFTVSRKNAELFFKAPSTPARLFFDVQPLDARVRVQGEQRDAAELRSNPFVIRARTNPNDLRHHVRWEVFLPGYREQAGTLSLEPGETKRLALTLAPQ